MIPDRLLDKTLKTKNPNTGYIFCILFRIILGLLIYFNKIPNAIIYLLYAGIIGFFSYKLYSTKNKTWKEYNRPLITYAISTMLFNNNMHNHAGLLIINDALIGLTSKHIQNNFAS